MAFIYRNRIGIVLGLIKFSLPFLLQNPVYELHRDEMLYLEQGNHLAWGFMEVPPLLAVFAKASLWMGGSFFWIKFWPSLFGALTLILTCSMARRMGGNHFAQFVAGICLIAGAYLRVHFLFQPNFLEIFFWTLSAYLLVRFINSKIAKYLYLLGIALALGWMSKYSVTFFIAGIIVGLAFTPNRVLFKNRYLYLAGLLALVLISPNLFWQFQHKWPVVHHMQELRETQLQFISPLSFLISQVLMHISYSYVFIGGLIWLFFFKSAQPYRILGWVYVTIIILLVATNGKDYYSLGAYPMLLAAGGVWLEQVTVKRLWIRYATLTVTLLLWLLILPVLLPIWKPAELAAFYRDHNIQKTGALHWEDLQDHELPQDFADMISWRELGEKVSQVYHDIPGSEKIETMIYCRNYALAGAVAYYGNNIPKPMSDNASFLFWIPEKVHVKNLIFVGRRIPEKDDLVFQQFEKYTVLDSITTPMARERGVKIILYENGNSEVNEMIETGIAKMKSEYQR